MNNAEQTPAEKFAAKYPVKHTPEQARAFAAKYATRWVGEEYNSPTPYKFWTKSGRCFTFCQTSPTGFWEGWNEAVTEAEVVASAR